MIYFLKVSHLGFRSVIPFGQKINFSGLNRRPLKSNWDLKGLDFNMCRFIDRD